MAKWLLRLIGLRMARRAFQGGRERAPMIDIGLGFALLRDARVPARAKLSAFGIGFVLLMVLQVLELPVELLIAALFNVAGIAFNIAYNGLELVAGPVVMASMLMPRMAPAHVVAQVRAERAGLIPQP